MKRIGMLIFIATLFGCSKQVDYALISNKEIDENISIIIPDAFAYATNLTVNSYKSLNGQVINTDPEVIESQLVNYLTDIYGSSFNQSYTENKEKCTPSFDNFTSLNSFSIDSINDDNAEGFIGSVFSSLESDLKSTSFTNSLSATMGSKVDALMSDIYQSANNYAIESLKSKVYDKELLKQRLLETITLFKNNMNTDNLSSEEKYTLLTSIATIENNINNTVDFASSYDSSEDLKSTNGWLKNLVKSVVKATIVTVCLLGGGLAGLAVGSVITGGNPVGMAVGAVAGLTGGFFLSGKINNWVDTW